MKDLVSYTQQLQSQIKALESSQAGNSNAQATLKQEIEKKEQSIKSLEKKVSDLQSVSRDNEEELATRDDAYRQLELEKQGLEGLIEQLKGKVQSASSIQMQYEEAAASLEDANEKIRQLKASNADNERAVGELVGGIETLYTTYTDWVNTMKTAYSDGIGKEIVDKVESEYAAAYGA